MLTLEELAVLLSLETEHGLPRGEVASYCLMLYQSVKFDERVALTVIDRLIALGYIHKNISGYLFLDPSGKQAIKETRSKTQKLLNKMAMT